MPYFLSKANTLRLLDADELMTELLVRHIKCDVPGCEELAVGVMISSVPGCLCLEHRDAHERNESRIKTVILDDLRRIMAEVANAAYSHGDDEIVLKYDGSDPLLDTARTSATPNELPPLILF